VCATTVRSYEPEDERAWLHCRVLSFLATAYFDDVLVAKPDYSDDSIELVAVDDSALVGLVDVVVDGSEATIETIAVDSGRFRRGVGSRLLEEALKRLPPTVRSLDAWTRDDEQANAWYKARGFVETFRYLHVYASGEDEVGDAIDVPKHNMNLVKGFFHADVEDESALRALFGRVHVCRRYELSL
jgi:ribosomal protein S18 acetylase RimI-like enzyme